MQISSKELVLFFLGEINKIRTHPKALLKHMQDRILRFDREQPLAYTRSDITSIIYKTKQGQKAVKQAYDYLFQTQQVAPLQLSFQLCEVAFVVGSKISKETVLTDIRKYQPKLLDELVNQKCRADCLQVILEYGFRKDAELLPSIIIDDGNESRSRRLALMSSRYKYIGIAVNEDKQFDYQLLILLAEEVEQVVEPVVETCQCGLI